MVFRRLLAVAAVPLLLIGLSSCQSDPTVAAYVGSDQITVDQIDSYFDKAATDPLSSELVAQNRAEVKPRLVSMLVFIKLLREAADDAGVPVTAGEVAQVKAQIEPQRQMITGDLALLPLDQMAEFQAHRLKLSQWASSGSASQAAAEKKYSDVVRAAEGDNPVTVNPRYGKFDLEKVPQLGSSDSAVKPASPDAS
ncbi:hypothetical protein GCM10009539_49950 [Cryptosporangium japonicum]|uniref:Lipoprotein n=1 Tax=Cryptosporangium japonicum TaxID=80872 RepID=A0ABN0UQY8_9ACTN